MPCGMPTRPAMRHKDFGIWQTWTWAQLRDEVRAFAVGLRKLGLERGDVGGHHRRQPPAPLRDLRGRAEPRRHPRARLPGLGGRRDGLRARARRGEVRRRRRTRSRSTRSSPSPSGCRSCARIIYDEERGLASLRSRPACIPSRTCRSSGREEMRRQPRRRGLVARRDRQGQGRGRQRDALHLGHHRPAQGRDADARQHHPLRAERQQVRRLHGRRHPARLSADGLGRRSHLLLRPGLRRRPCACAARRARRPWSRTGARSAPPISSRRRACSRTCSPRSWCAWRTRAG